VTQPGGRSEGESATDLAVVELLGALAYGQLRAFVAAASAVPLASDVECAQELAGHAAREHERWLLLRARLDDLTDLPSSVLERQRPTFDAFFAARPDDWLNATVALAVGLPMAADFARAVAPTVDAETGRLLVETLADRDAFEAFAMTELRAQLDAGPKAHETARRAVAELVGRALTGFQGALGETDALRVLFDEHAQHQGTTPESVVKHLALEVLEAHRRRMLALGLDDLE